jgi:hypothetical protein
MKICPQQKMNIIKVGIITLAWILISMFFAANEQVSITSNMSLGELMWSSKKGQIS